MAQISKVVRFYEPQLIDQQDQATTIEPGFWTEIRKAVEQADAKQRTVTYSGVEYYGRAAVGSSPAVRYLYIGRKRPRADWPDYLNEELDEVSDLPLAIMGKLLERAYIVPFGTGNSVACMPPFGARMSMSAVDRWLTHLAGATATEHRIELVPIIDEAVMEKLADAEGVTRLNVRFSADTRLPPRAPGEGQVERGLRAAEQMATDSRTAELTLSYGRSRADAAGRKTLLKLTRMVTRAENLDKAEATMLLPDGDGLKSEAHDLLKDKIATTVKIDAEADAPATESSVLSAMQEAIQAFRERG